MCIGTQYQICLVNSRIKQQHWIVQHLEQQEIHDVAMGTSNPCSFSASNRHFSKSIQPRPLSPVKTIFKELRWRRNWKLSEQIHHSTKTCQVCPFTFYLHSNSSVATISSRLRTNDHYCFTWDCQVPLRRTTWIRQHMRVHVLQWIQKLNSTCTGPMWM